MTSEPTSVECEVLIDYLRSETGGSRKNDWRTAGQIEENTGIRPTKLRAICQKYPTAIIGSNEGYKLTRYASVAELNDSLRVLLSRSLAISTRATYLHTYIAARTQQDAVAALPTPRLDRWTLT